MPLFAANLSMLYTELPFLDRFAAAAADGFKVVEFLFPYEHPAEAIAQRLREHGLRQGLFNAPPGDWAAGERGTAALPGREAEFRDGFQRLALPYAQALGCPRIHVMSGLATRGAQRATYLDNLRWAAALAAPLGIGLMIEPLNPRDVPGYLFSRQAEAHAVVQELGLDNVKVQMDLYHCQIVEGDLATRLRALLPTGRVGHLQIAGVPERHEPDVGEVNHAYLFSLLDELGWQGPVGCEYRPRDSGPGGTTAGLGWFQAWRDRQA